MNRALHRKLNHQWHITALALALGAAYPALAVEEEPITKVEVKGQNATDDSYLAGSAHTSTRMEMSIRDTPQSVSVVSRALMDDFGLTRLDEALGLTTGVMVGQMDSERTSFYARGFAITNIQVDSMPMGANSPLSDTILYDRIEIVRGASGLMGGTGDPSAAVNMVRKRPGKTLQGSASAIFKRWNDRRVEADLSTPLSADGSVRGRVAIAHEERDSYMDMYHEDKTIGMAIVEADLTPATLLTASIDFQRNKPTGATWGAVPYWYADGTLANLPRNFSLTTPWSTWANKQHTAFVSIDQRFGEGWKLHLGYARTDSRNNTTVANGGSGHPNPLPAPA
jgi:outer membrane receptor for ferric coprogen and ferric-rhodotorulic acid